jgi:hypothetical protein
MLNTFYGRDANEDGVILSPLLCSCTGMSLGDLYLYRH